MSDFSLMDAIECGIVKLPRVPVADNIPGDDMPMFRNLWENIRQEHAEEGARQGERCSTRSRCPPGCRPRSRRFTATTRRPSSCGRRRVSACRPASSSSATTPRRRSWSTTTSRASTARTRTARRLLQNGRLALFRNFDEHGNPLPRPNTLLIDSEQLEIGEALDDNFRSMAADEIERFRREIVERTGIASAGGQPHRPGAAARGHEHRRQAGRWAAQSAAWFPLSMLTEGGMPTL